ncbi:MAG: VanW family protein [Firmicutes bacterium]|nr:VanW family protein [Bacillota bacterium]
MQENNNNNEDMEPEVSKETEINTDNTDTSLNNTENTASAENGESSYYFDDDDEDDFAVPAESTAEASEPYEETPEPSDVLDDERNTMKKKRSAVLKKLKIAVIAVLIAAACAFIALYSYAVSTISQDRIMENVYVRGLDVGGLTYDEAVASINASYLFDEFQITLTSGGQTFTISAADIGLSAIAEETAEKAMNYSKTGNFFTNGFTALKLLFEDHVIVPALQADTDMLDAKLNEFGNAVLGERIQHYIELGDDGMATVYSGQTGYNGDPTEAREAVLTALANEQFDNIEVSFTAAAPDEMTLEAFDAFVYKEAVNASYEINGNDVTVVPGDTGRYIDKDEAAALLQNVYEGCEPVKIPFYVSQPEVTAQTLRDKLFADTLGTYSTSFSGSSSNRSLNVARAASLINGTVVASGETFSFNDTLGHRTVENGFYTAKEYLDGKTVDGIGGGTCQVSSTLYSAVLYADMNIVERLNHMMTVSYIPLGQDATVADGGVDFKFKNTSDYPIKISATTSGTTITVSIIGTQWDPPREVKISHSTSMNGENTVVQSTRYVYVNGELVSTDKLNTSTYMPHSSD